MQWLWYGRVRRTVLIGAGCASFLAGLGFSLLGWPASWVWTVSGLLLLSLCTKRIIGIALPAVIVAGLLLGLGRGADMQQSLRAYQPFFGQKVVLHGGVSEDLRFDDKGQLDIRLSNVAIHGQKAPGEVRVKSFAPLSPRRGDVLEARGKLQSGFGNYQASVYYASLRVMSHNESVVEKSRRVFAAAVYNTVPEPQASLGLGFLVGMKSQLPEALSDQLKILGLTHIVVASGYNLTVLVRMARRLFQKRSVYQTVAVAGTLIAGFLAVTGFSPSMSRAAFVTSIALLAWYYGRRAHPVMLLLLTAAITAGLNPLYMWGDAGWWLSFLAFAGIMLLAPLIQRRIFYDKKPGFVTQVLLETVSAQIATLPFIVWLFGDIAMLSLVANLLVTPLVPLAMLLTAIAGAAGLVVPLFAPYIALPAAWLLTYITDITSLLARVPHATMSFTIGLPVMLAAYAALVLAGIVLWRKTKYDYLSSSIIE